MKICFIGPSESMHMRKWCDWFSNHGHKIYVITFSQEKIKGVRVYSVKTDVDKCGNDINKIGYLFKGKKVKELVDKIEPDIVNVHYATSYGMTAALSGIKNYTLSIWGSDVYEFPRKSIFHRIMLCYSLHKATYLFSTSYAMAVETKKYTKKSIEITPFGVDMELFNPSKRFRSETQEDEFIIGTVKALEKIYGISYLLKAVAIVRCERPDIPIKLRISGKGSEEQKYRCLARKLGISDITEWLGFINQEDAAVEWANMDVAVIPSVSESFGVAAVEAQACGTPVIISNIPGLMEATCPEKTSIVVPQKNEKEIATAIIKMYANPNMRKKMGEEGIRFVSENYEINSCFKKIETAYKKNYN